MGPKSMKLSNLETTNQCPTLGMLLQLGRWSNLSVGQRLAAGPPRGPRPKSDLLNFETGSELGQNGSKEGIQGLYGEPKEALKRVQPLASKTRHFQ